MRLTLESLKDKSAWEKAGVALPRFDVAAMTAKTKESPLWVHFGAGNIFRSFIAPLQQRLLEQGLAERGITVAEGFDGEIIDAVYTPFDNLTLSVTLNPDATVGCEVVASVAEALRADTQLARLAQAFEAPELQMVSFTITEKGYALKGADGVLLPAAKADIEKGPAAPRHAMGILTALLLHRFRAGAHPIACVSMDNCSHNGEKLGGAVAEIANEWVAKGFADKEFADYVSDGDCVSFPWSMIDKITPRPADSVEKMLAERGLEDMKPLITAKGSYMAAFVNAERPQYLVVEDKFPAGRPALEKAGVYFTDRETVNNVERMKVTTCLNPLHTAISVYGCLLGYTLICDEMKDAGLVALVRRLGYVEGLPVVTDPGILSPRAFIDEVVNERLPNPFMPDDPRRIATDTSQKVGIRFGETVKSYIATGRDLAELVAIPLAIAGWMRYLLGVDDAGNPMEVSADPMKETLQAALAGIAWNSPGSYKNQLRGILSNAAIFGLDLTQTPLAGKIEGYFLELLEGPGAARRVLEKYLS